MSVQDALWLTMDRPNNLMVVDGAMVLRGKPKVAAVNAVVSKMLENFPVLTRKPVPAGTGWAWQDDPDFELERHLEWVKLDKPMKMVGLQQFLAERRTDPLPKDRPLWRVTVVSPVTLDDGRRGSAVVTRFHHSIADGVRLTQVLLSLCEADNKSVAAVVSRKGTTKHESTGEHEGILGSTTHVAADAASTVRHEAAELIEGAKEAIRHPLQTVSRTPHLATAGVQVGVQIGAGAVDLVRHPDRLLDALEVLGVENYRATNDLSSVTKLALTGSPETVWSGEPGTVKAIAWSKQIPLDSIKAVGRRAGATVNDVLLAAVAGGLRRYLAQRDTSIDEAVWMVPVNLKPFEENLPPDLGNYFALVFVPMPLDSDAADERLAAMHHRMERIKNSDEAVLTFGLQRIVSMSPGQVAFFLTNFFANKAIGVLTNVPGPQFPVTFAGVPVEQITGFAPCSGNQPMTATIFSYNGGVTVGFAADAGLVPDPDVLAQLVVDDLAGMGVEVN